MRGLGRWGTNVSFWRRRTIKKKKTIGYTNHMCDTKLQVHLSKIPTCKKLLEIIKRL